MRKEEQKGFMIYPASMRALKSVSKEIAGDAIQRGIDYFLSGEAPSESDDITVNLVTMFVTEDVERSITQYEKIRQRNTQNRNKNLKKPMVTSGDQSFPVVTNDNDNENENENVNVSENVSENVCVGETQFQPPTVEEIRAYCQEIGSGINPEKFHDYYTARGWMLSGGIQMKDWKAVIRTWKTPNDGRGNNGDDDQRSKYDQQFGFN